MAKDKEKLFKGADDKAITFQRAVFIVCNLKRLIKRPKKEEKHSQASGSSCTSTSTSSRKRSGFQEQYYYNNEFCQQQQQQFADFYGTGHPPQRGGGGGGRKGGVAGCGDNQAGRSRGFRDPVRRAFTLPTMLCNSFNPSPSQLPECIGGASAGTRAALAELMQEAVLQQEQLKLQLQQPSSLVAPPPSATDLTLILPTPLEPGGTPTSSRSAEGGAASSKTRATETIRRTGDGGGGGGGGTRKCRFGDIYNVSGSISDDEHSEDIGDSEPEMGVSRKKEIYQNQRLLEPTMAASNMSSLSCLVTPIRRAYQPREEPSGGYNHKSSMANLSLMSTKSNTTNHSDKIPSTDHSKGRCHSTERGRGPERQTFVCCPVWAYAMQQLDMRQQQPRGEQSSFNMQSIEPPPEAGYLLGSQHETDRGTSFEDTATVGDTTPNDSGTTKAAAGGLIQPRLVVCGNPTPSGSEVDEDDWERSQADHWTTTTTSNRQPEKEEEVESYSSRRACHSNRRASDEQLAERRGKSRATCNQENPVLHFGTSDCKSANSSDFEQTKAQVDKTNEEQQPGNKLSQVGQFTSETTTTTTTRMKQFSSSALHLAEAQNVTPANEKAQERKETTRAKLRPLEQQHQQQQQQQQQQANKEKRKKSSQHQTNPTAATSSFLTPEDPIFLARQRRPSASNQGSLNVDQQALFSAVECNQLERAKTILEEGKANVNSLNGDKLTCLDIAVLMRNFKMVRLLQQHNAKESLAYLSRDARANQLYALYMEAKRLVEDLSRSLELIASSASTSNQECKNISSSNYHAPSAVQSDTPSETNTLANQQQQPQPAALLLAATGSLLSSALFEEKQGQLQYWRRRLDLFMHMRFEFERLQIPTPPELIVLQVVGENSLGVKIVHSLRPQQQQLQQQPAPVVVNQQPEEENGEFRRTVGQHAQVAIPLDEALARCCDPNCSHWILGDFNHMLATTNKSQHQQQQESVYNGPNNNKQTTKKQPSNVKLSLTAIQDHSVSKKNNNINSSLKRREQLLKEQKLAVFNQMIAQQLIMLSYQQQSNAAAAAGSGASNSHEQAPGEFCSQVNVDNLKSANQQLQQQNNQLTLIVQQQNKSRCLPEADLMSDDRHAQQLEPSIAYQLITGASRAEARSRRDANTFRAKGVGARQRSVQVNDTFMGCGPHSAIDSQGGVGVPTSDFSPADQQAGDYWHAHLQNDQTHFGPKIFYNSSASSNTRSPIKQEQSLLSHHHLHHLEDGGSMIITKYKIEWSLNESMKPIVNSMIVYNTNSYPLECQIGDLINNQLYYVRVSAGNHRGFSESRPTTPICLQASSWRQVSGNKSRRKYDEEVFRKFTKLILLNKHILDDHQTAINLMVVGSSGSNCSQSQSQQQQQQQAQQLLLSHSSTSAGGAIWSQNKSTLINMLLMDATMPAAATVALSGEQLRIQQAEDSIDQQQQQQQQTSLSVRKNLKNFFQSNSFKFHKLNNHNKRGLYLTTVIYHQQQQQQQSSSGQQSANLTSSSLSNLISSNGSDKIVVTNDDRLPIIEVVNDLVSPAALMSDFYWLLKINGTQWIDIKRLRQQLQKSHSSSTLHLRIKLLSAIEQMQLALNMEDIGRLFYKPIQAHDGSIVICTCKQVSSTKLVSNLSIKWTSQLKIIPRHLRKISDSMLQRQQQQQEKTPDQANITQNLYSNRVKKSADSNQLLVSSMSSLSQSATILPATTSKQPTVAVAAPPGEHQLNNQNQACQGESDYLYHGHETTGKQLAGEFKLCEYCQYSLVQRRCTLASGSSNSSLASSSESQWSNGSQQMLAGGGAAGSNQLSSGKCNCQRLKAAGSCSNSQHWTTSSGFLNAPNSANPSQQIINPTTCGPSTSSNIITTPRHSTAGSFSASISSQQYSGSGARSSSMISGGSGMSCSTPTHSMSGSNSRLSQPQHLTLAQSSSSTYLMLASLSLYDLLLFSLNEIIQFDRSSTIPLSRGLYLGFVQLQTTVDSMRLLVPRSRPNMVPCARIRDNSHVSKEEWLLLKQFGNIAPPNPGVAPTRPNGGRGQGESSASELVKNEESNSEGERSGETNSSSLRSLEENSVKLTTKEKVDNTKETTNELREGEGSQAASQLLQRKESCQTKKRAKSVSPGMGEMVGVAGCDSIEKVALDPTMTCRSRVSSLSVCQTEIEVSRQNGILLRSPERGDTPTSHHSDPNVAKQEFEFEVEAENLNVGASAPSIKRNALATKNQEECCQAGNRKVSISSMTSRPKRSSPTLGGSRLTLNGGGLSCMLQSPEETFVRLVGSAAARLLGELKSNLPKVYDEQSNELTSILQSLNDPENNRIYHIELIELNNQVSFILLIPAAENVCPVTSQEKSNILADNQEYMLLALQIFETIHIGTYEQELLAKYSRLSAILETDLIVAQHDHRQAFSSNELKSTKSRVANLQEMVSIAEEFWRQLRWIVDVVSFARDKSIATNTTGSSTSSASGAVKLGSIWRYFELAPSASTFIDNSISGSLAGGASWQSNVVGERMKKTGFQAAIKNQQQHKEAVKRTTSARSRADNEKSSGTLSGMVGVEDSGNNVRTKNGSKNQKQTGTIIRSTNNRRLPVTDSVPDVRLIQSSMESSVLSTDKKEDGGFFVLNRESRVSEDSSSSKIGEFDEHQQLQQQLRPRSSSSDTKFKEEEEQTMQKIQPTNKISTHQTQARSSSSLSAASSSSSLRKLDDDPRDDDDDESSPASMVLNEAQASGQLEPTETCFQCNLFPSHRPVVEVKEEEEEEGVEVEEVGRLTSCSHKKPAFSFSPAQSCSQPEGKNKKIIDHEQVALDVDVDVGDEDEDEEAIYAYHISLKDATRAALARKSSQQSIRAFVEEPLLSSAGSSSFVRGAQNSINNPQVAPPMSQIIDDHHHHHNKQEVNSKSRPKMAPKMEKQSPPSGGTTKPPPPPPPPSRTHFKPTNPFLSDSFDSN